MQETSASVVHHVDYLNRRDDHALCGVVLGNPTMLGQTAAPDAVCIDCEALLVTYHLTWWRTMAMAAEKELDELRVKYRELAEYSDNQGRQLAALQPIAEVNEELSAKPSESRRDFGDEQHRESTSKQAGTAPTPFLDRARRELTELCRQCDGAVPYWR